MAFSAPVLNFSIARSLFRRHGWLSIWIYIFIYFAFRYYYLYFWSKTCFSISSFPRRARGWWFDDFDGKDYWLHISLQKFYTEAQLRCFRLFTHFSAWMRVVWEKHSLYWWIWLISLILLPLFVAFSSQNYYSRSQALQSFSRAKSIIYFTLPFFVTLPD